MSYTFPNGHPQIADKISVTEGIRNLDVSLCDKI